MLKCADIFGNDMVLQRDKQVPVWGTAEPGAKVSLSLQGRNASAQGDRVTLTVPGLEDADGLEVRFACTGWYAVNLYNSAGIAAVPGKITL